MDLICEKQIENKDDFKFIFRNVKDENINSILVFLKSFNTLQNVKTAIDIESGIDFVPENKTNKKNKRRGNFNGVYKIREESKINEEIDWVNFGEKVMLEDKFGNKDWFYKIPKLKCEDLFPNGELGYGTYPAFLTRDEASHTIIEKDFIYIAISPASKNEKDIPISVEKVEDKENDLWADIDFDTAREKCKEKGEGYHMLTIWEWALCAFLSYKCNTHIGAKDFGFHNGKENGIALLWGKNVNWTWIDGFKQDEKDNWRINEINDIKLNDKDGEFFWKELGKRPKWFEKEDCGRFENIDCDGEFGNEEIHLLFARALLIPDPVKFSGYVWYITGERLPRRGGRWNYGASAGLGALYLDLVRSNSYTNIGFRFAFL